jgi:hypothetical protein
VFQPGPGGVREEQGKVADDEVVVVRSSQLAGQPVVHKPQLRSRLPRVLGDSSRGSEPCRERCPSYGPAEGLRTWWFGRRTPILPTVVAPSTPGMIASAHPLVEAGSTVVAMLRVAEAVRGGRRPVPRAFVVDRGLPYVSGHVSGGCCVTLRGAPLPSRGRALGLSDRSVLQEILEFALDTSPLGGGWLWHRSEQYCCCSQVLAGLADARGRCCPGIANDTALDLLGPMTHLFDECLTCSLLLDVLPKLCQPPCFLVELGLYLADLLELCVLTPCKD